MAVSLQVPLFWKLALKEPCPLRSAKLPPAAYNLCQVPDLHVTLLYYGGHTARKAANRLGVSQAQFQQIELELQERSGEVVPVHVDSICIHHEVVFANVVLARGFPCLNPEPFVKFRKAPEASGSVVIELRQRGDKFVVMNLPQPITMCGVIELESGTPFPNQVPRGPQYRRQRMPHEVQGHLVHVKKHSSMRCAQITFPSEAVRDAVLQQCLQEKLCLRGVPLDVRKHIEKTSCGQRLTSPDAIFAAWQHHAFDITADHLQVFFDSMARFFSQHLCEIHKTAPSGYLDLYQVAVEERTLPHDQFSDVMLMDKAGEDAAPVYMQPSMDRHAEPTKQSGRATSLDQRTHGEGRDHQTDSEGSLRLSSDEIELAVLRLTRMAHSEEVTSVLLNSPLLEKCHSRVKAAGCEVMPDWAEGAKLLTPLTANQVRDAGLILKHHHIVTMHEDVELVQRALAEIPYRRRAKVSREACFVLPECMCSFASSLFNGSDSGREPSDAVEVVVECSVKTDSSIGYLSC